MPLPQIWNIAADQDHRAVLGRGVPLIEHVINLETFEETEFEMFAFPMKLYKIEGAPARVVARVGSE